MLVLVAILCGAIFEKLGYFSYINPFIKSFLFAVKSHAVKDIKKAMNLFLPIILPSSGVK